MTYLFEFFFLLLYSPMWWAIFSGQLSHLLLFLDQFYISNDGEWERLFTSNNKPCVLSFLPSLNMIYITCWESCIFKTYEQDWFLYVHLPSWSLSCFFLALFCSFLNSGNYLNFTTSFKLSFHIKQQNRVTNFDHHLNDINYNLTNYFVRQLEFSLLFQRIPRPQKI